MEGGQSSLGLLNISGSEQRLESLVGEQVTLPTQEPSGSVKAKFVKGKNWSSEEDKVLIQAWANTSLDAVPATYQHSTSYWGRISDHYNRHKNPSWSERNANALSCRYNTISSKTSKFCECVGMTNKEKPEEAHLLYIAKDLNRKPFTLMHCYLEFEKHPKWQTHLVSQKKQKKATDASPGTTSNDDGCRECIHDLETGHALMIEKHPKWQTHLVSQKKQKKAAYASPGTTSNDDDCRGCTHDLETGQILLDMKHEKEYLRRDKASAYDGSGCKLLLETSWAQKLENDETKEATKKARYARAFELQEKQIALQERKVTLQEREEARKQLELEEKIMSMDASGMSAGQKQFYKDKQEEIIARRYNTSG